MKKLIFTFIILLAITVNSSAQYKFIVSNNVFVSEGITYGQNQLTGTLGIHYFFTPYFGTSLQSNFVNNFGWYYDAGILKGNYKFIASAGYNANRNCISYSLRFGFRLGMFYE